MFVTVSLIKMFIVNSNPNFNDVFTLLVKKIFFETFDQDLNEIENRGSTYKAKRVSEVAFIF